MYHIKKGLELPLAGVPDQSVVNHPEDKRCRHVALVGADYVGMRPSLLVKEGDRVALGQPLFACKKVEGVVYTSLAAGRVVRIARGERRAFESLAIAVDGDERQVELSHFKGENSSDVRALLLESGLWTSLRTRPWSKVPAANSEAHSLFITATDTAPHAPAPAPIIRQREQDFSSGVSALCRLMEGRQVYLCHAKGETLPVPQADNLQAVAFSGIHPAGLVGTHIHLLDPVGAKKLVWHIGYQDVIAIGALFSRGVLDTRRVISLAGPMASRPRLIHTRIGACISELVEGEISPAGKKDIRAVSGSVLSGRKAHESENYLGRYHQQISLLQEDRARHFLGWQSPGWDKYSAKGTFLSRLFPGKRFALGTNRHGSDRAMVPVGCFEKVMPLDLLPTQLLRSIVTQDADLAVQLGALELDEEDLALCTFVSPGKVDFGPLLRQLLTTVEREG